MSGSARGRKRLERPDLPEIPPSVIVIIAAHNEESRIADRIRNVLAQDYPVSRLRVIVVSDGSTDQTAQVASEFVSSRVHLLELKKRVGKMDALNRAIQTCPSVDVLAFSDANTRFEPDVVAKVSAWFSLRDVGCVCGRLDYEIPADSAAFPAPHGEVGYWSWDTRIKAAEGQVGEMIGGNGAILALRPALAAALPPEQANDMIWPLWARHQGYHAIFDPDARVTECHTTDLGAEYRRRVRIVAQGLRGVGFALSFLFREPDAASRGPVASSRLRLIGQLLAKKLCRYLAVPALLAMVGLGAFAPSGMTLQCARALFVVMAGIGALAAAEIGLGRVPPFLPDVRYAATMAAAALAGCGKFLTGWQTATWETERSADAPQAIIGASDETKD